MNTDSLEVNETITAFCAMTIPLTTRKKQQKPGTKHRIDTFRMDKKNKLTYHIRKSSNLKLLG